MPGYLQVPEWFLRITAWAATAFVLLFVPWAAWMSRQVIEFGTHLNQIPELAQRVTVIETEVGQQGQAIRRLQKIREFKMRPQ